MTTRNAQKTAATVATTLKNTFFRLGPTAQSLALFLFFLFGTFGIQACQENPVDGTDQAGASKSIAYLVRNGNVGAIGTMNADGTNAEIISEEIPNPLRLQASPNGKSVLVEFDDGGNSNEIYEFDLETGTYRSVANGPSADYSPDGSRVIFTDDGGDVYEIDLRTGSEEKLATTPPLALIRYSPDGSSIVMIAEDDIYLMNSDGTDIQKLNVEPTTQPYSMLAWSPDGSTITFSGTYTLDDGEISVLSSYNLLTGEEKPVAGFRDPSVLTPAYSPDGTTVVYMQTDATGKSWLYRVNADGTDTKIYSAKGACENFEFTKDGRSVLLADNGVIMKIDVATGSMAQISRDVNSYFSAPTQVR